MKQNLTGMCGQLLQRLSQARAMEVARHKHIFLAISTYIVHIQLD